MTVIKEYNSSTSTWVPIVSGVQGPIAGRNKIINGGMVINQRGATVTGAATQQLVTDRWSVYNSVGTVTFQQSTTAPSGFTHSLLATVSATGSYGTGGYTLIGQFIEGYNTADLAWGTSAAKTVTVSFWVRSSVTGTYTVVLQNGGQSRSYVSTYTINSANTWEQKSVTITGETTGTWLTDNGLGLLVWFGLGVGTSWDTTSGAWQSVNAYGINSSVDFAANSGATFYLTGVQVEQNTTATSFEYRQYGAELALCQRYFFKITGTSQYEPVASAGINYSGSQHWRTFTSLPVPMRKAITTSDVSYSTLVAYDGSGVVFINAVAVVGHTIGSTMLNIDWGSAGGLVTGRPVVILTNPGSSAYYFQVNAEL